MAYVVSGAHFNATWNRVRAGASPAARGLDSERRGCCFRAGEQTWAERMSCGTIGQVWKMGREDHSSVFCFQVGQGVREKKMAGMGHRKKMGKQEIREEKKIYNIY